MHHSDPFYNGAQEVRSMYMRIYGIDYRKAYCSKGDFEYKAIGLDYQHKPLLQKDPLCEIGSFVSS